MGGSSPPLPPEILQRGLSPSENFAELNCLIILANPETLDVAKNKVNKDMVWKHD